MEKFMMASIFFTEIITLIVLGLIVLGLCVFLFDYLKKNVSIEKKIKQEKSNPDTYGWEREVWK